MTETILDSITYSCNPNPYSNPISISYAVPNRYEVQYQYPDSPIQKFYPPEGSKLPITWTIENLAEGSDGTQIVLGATIFGIDVEEFCIPVCGGITDTELGGVISTSPVIVSDTSGSSIESEGGFLGWECRVKISGLPDWFSVFSRQGNIARGTTKVWIKRRQKPAPGSASPVNPTGCSGPTKCLFTIWDAEGARLLQIEGDKCPVAWVVGCVFEIAPDTGLPKPTGRINYDLKTTVRDLVVSIGEYSATFEIIAGQSLIYQRWIDDSEDTIIRGVKFLLEKSWRARLKTVVPPAPSIEDILAFELPIPLVPVKTELFSVESPPGCDFPAVGIACGITRPDFPECPPETAFECNAGGKTCCYDCRGDLIFTF